MLGQLKEIFRLYWVSGIVLLSTVLLLVWLALGYESAFEREPGFTFDEQLTLMVGILTTIVATTFSSIFVALQLASGQFSPRIVRGFFREDWRVQAVLMVFVVGISYCLIIKFLGLTHPHDHWTAFGWKISFAAPGLVGGMLLILMVFPYFIYYIIRNINAAKITRNICDRTIREIEVHFKDRWVFADQDCYDPVAPPDSTHLRKVTAAENGYLAHLNPALLKLLFLLGHKAYVLKFVGSFVAKGSVIALIDYKGNSRSYARVIDSIVRRAMKIHDYRSYTQDINFGIRQLVDIAIKAISPAVNDPTTAITCLNYLGEIVREFGQYKIPSAATIALERQGIYVHEFNFDKVVDHAFNQIYFWGRQDSIIVRHMVHIITEILPHIQNPYNLCVLIQEVEDFELLGKTSAELKEIFILREHVESLERNYLSRFVSAAVAKIDDVFAQVKQLPADESSICQSRYQTNLDRLTAYKEDLLAYQALLEKR